MDKKSRIVSNEDDNKDEGPYPNHINDESGIINDNNNNNNLAQQPSMAAAAVHAYSQTLTPLPATRMRVQQQQQQQQQRPSTSWDNYYKLDINTTIIHDLPSVIIRRDHDDNISGNDTAGSFRHSSSNNRYFTNHHNHSGSYHSGGYNDNSNRSGETIIGNNNNLVQQKQPEDGSSRGRIPIEIIIGATSAAALLLIGIILIVSVWLYRLHHRAATNSSRTGGSDRQGQGTTSRKSTAKSASAVAPATATLSASATPKKPGKFSLSSSLRLDNNQQLKIINNNINDNNKSKKCSQQQSHTEYSITIGSSKPQQKLNSSLQLKPSSAWDSMSLTFMDAERDLDTTTKDEIWEVASSDESYYASLEAAITAQASGVSFVNSSINSISFNNSRSSRSTTETTIISEETET